MISPTAPPCWATIACEQYTFNIKSLNTVTCYEGGQKNRKKGQGITFSNEIRPKGRMLPFQDSV